MNDKAISHAEDETTEDTTVSAKLRINEQKKANIQSEASSPVETIAETENIVDEAKRGMRRFARSKAQSISLNNSFQAGLSIL